MALIDANDLVHLRAAQEDAMPDTCTIRAAVTSKDASGGPVTTWPADTYTSVACRIVAIVGDEEFEVGRRVVKARWMLTLPYDQTIDETMQVVCNGTTFRVLFVDDDKSHNTCKRVKLGEMT